jgi:hypothetical protein
MERALWMTVRTTRRCIYIYATLKGHVLQQLQQVVIDYCQKEFDDGSSKDTNICVLGHSWGGQSLIGALTVIIIIDYYYYQRGWRWHGCFHYLRQGAQVDCRHVYNIYRDPHDILSTRQRFIDVSTKMECYAGGGHSHVQVCRS